jgi:hypothetical protein
MTPIFLLCGNAGVGKDTVADILCNNGYGVSIAQADPIKMYAQYLFDFSYDQLWGPSSARSQTKPELSSADWKNVIDKSSFYAGMTQRWLKYISPNEDAYLILKKWIVNFKEKFENQKLSPRLVCQQLGTEFGRSISPDIWSELAIKNAKKLLNGGYAYSPSTGPLIDVTKRGYDFVVIKDGRFRSEVLNVNCIGGKSFKIISNEDLSPNEKHSSETEIKQIPNSWFNRIILNDQSLGIEDLNLRIKHMVIQGLLE